MAKPAESIKAQQKRALKVANKLGLSLQQIQGGDIGVWPEAAARDLRSLTLPPAK
jgi:hypothetical protein